MSWIDSMELIAKFEPHPHPDGSGSWVGAHYRHGDRRLVDVGWSTPDDPYYHVGTFETPAEFWIAMEALDRHASNPVPISVRELFDARGYLQSKQSGGFSTGPAPCVRVITPEVSAWFTNDIETELRVADKGAGGYRQVSVGRFCLPEHFTGVMHPSGSVAHAVLDAVLEARIAAGDAMKPIED
jgi:hypothetical protein